MSQWYNSAMVCIHSMPNEAQVPGTLLVAGDDMHFVQTRARVSAADYLGLRALKVGAAL